MEDRRVSNDKRFISTCVETVNIYLSLSSPASVHLHVCGDSTLALLAHRIDAGSSPRVWRQRRHLHTNR